MQFFARLQERRYNRVQEHGTQALNPNACEIIDLRPNRMIGRSGYETWHALCYKVPRKELMRTVQRIPLRSGSCVSFRLGDAICPGFGQVAGQVGPDVRVCGEVAFFSDRGQDAGHFAIIAVDGVSTPLVVPVAKLEPFATRPVTDDASSEALDPLEQRSDRREVG